MTSELHTPPFGHPKPCKLSLSKHHITPNTVNRTIPDLDFSSDLELRTLTSPSGAGLGASTTRLFIAQLTIFWGFFCALAGPWTSPQTSGTYYLDSMTDGISW